MMDFEETLNLFDYKYPKKLIALSPASPRDSARLLVCGKAGKLWEVVFRDLPKVLPKGAVLVLNQTKVLPARFTVQKSTGGLVELLFIGEEGLGVKVLSPKKLEVGAVLAPASQEKGFHDLHLQVWKQNRDGGYLLKVSDKNRLFEYLRQKGKMPLPPYLKNSTLPEKHRQKEYQTVFGKKEGAVAAPTAGLHFTPKSLQALKKSGIVVCFITLHTGLGTFAPLKAENLALGRLHKEYFEIDKKTADVLNKAKKMGKPVIAVGTTTVRTLESASDKKGRLVRFSGQTDLFIREHTPLKFVDGLITNFHVPKSSLLMLVSAFVGRERLMRIYAYAIRKKFRLFSFGDAMCILPENVHMEEKRV